MAYADVLAEANVEVSETTRVMIQLAKRTDTGAIELSLNKQFRKRDNPDWQWGKGFTIPQELTTEFLQKIGEVMGLEVQFALDSDDLDGSDVLDAGIGTR